MTVLETTISDDWKLWFDPYDAPSVGRGSSGTVLAIDDSLVIKTYVGDEEGQEDFRREKAIFELLQCASFSPYIVRFVEEWESGLVLERMSGTLRSHLKEEVHVSEENRERWMRESCQGLQFLHENGIMHGDVGCHNFLVDRHGRVKLCDFAGSSREGESARICYEVRGRHPNYKIGTPTVETEIFALGSTLFEICSSHTPYLEETHDFVQMMFRLQNFPLSEIHPKKMRQIIERCWTTGYTSVAHVYGVLPLSHTRLDTFKTWNLQGLKLHN